MSYTEILNSEVSKSKNVIYKAEKSIYGHKNSPLWYALRRCKKTSIELEGFKWMLLKSYLTSQESRK